MYYVHSTEILCLEVILIQPSIMEQILQPNRKRIHIQRINTHPFH